MKLVSIIIVSYNSEEYIEKCIQSIYQQTYPSFEIIVYDNCSQDETCRIIETKFPQVKLILGEENIGFAKANNKAAAIAKGEILAFINPDVFVSPEWLEPQLEVLNHDPVGCVTPAILLADRENLLNAYGNKVHFSGMAYCNQYGKERLAWEPFEVEAISGAAFLIKKDTFMSISGFEESYFMYYEDTDLSMRIRRLGLVCFVVPQASVYHAYKNHFYPRKVFYLERNRYFSLLTLVDGWLLLCMGPSLLLIEFVTWGYCFLHGWETIKAKLNSWGAIIGNLSWIKERRKKSKTKVNDYQIVLNGFSDHLDLDYLGEGFLTKLVEFFGFLTAKPILFFVKKFTKKKSASLVLESKKEV